MPRVAIVPTDMPNAFATGRSPKHAAVAVTQGLLDRLEPHELEGVIAHELSHVAHRDVAIMTLASFFAMVAGFITRWGFFFGGGFGGGRRRQQLGQRLHASCSWCRSSSTRSRSSSSARSRATASSRPTGAPPILTKSPSSLASALVKISGAMGRIPQQRHAHGRGPEPVLHHPRPGSRAASRTSSPTTRRSRPGSSSCAGSSAASKACRNLRVGLRAGNRVDSSAPWGYSTVCWAGRRSRSRRSSGCSPCRRPR